MTKSNLGPSAQGTKERLKLKTLCGTPMPTPLFLPLAINIAQALEVLHQREIIYKDITPDRIFFNPQTYAATFDAFTTTSHLTYYDSAGRKNTSDQS